MKTNITGTLTDLRILMQNSYRLQHPLPKPIRTVSRPVPLMKLLLIYEHRMLRNCCLINIIVDYRFA